MAIVIRPAPTPSGRFFRIRPPSSGANFSGLQQRTWAGIHANDRLPAGAFAAGIGLCAAKCERAFARTLWTDHRHPTCNQLAMMAGGGRDDGSKSRRASHSQLAKPRH